MASWWSIEVRLNSCGLPYGIPRHPPGEEKGVEVNGKRTERYAGKGRAGCQHQAGPGGHPGLLVLPYRPAISPAHSLGRHHCHRALTGGAQPRTALRKQEEDCRAAHPGGHRAAGGAGRNAFGHGHRVLPVPLQRGTGRHPDAAAPIGKGEELARGGREALRALGIRFAQPRSHAESAPGGGDFGCPVAAFTDRQRAGNRDRLPLLFHRGGILPAVRAAERGFQQELLPSPGG